MMEKQLISHVENQTENIDNNVNSPQIQENQPFSSQTNNIDINI